MKRYLISGLALLLVGGFCVANIHPMKAAGSAAADEEKSNNIEPKSPPGESPDEMLNVRWVVLDWALAEDLKKGGTRLQLGVNVDKPTATLTKQLKLPQGMGLVVANVVEKSAAEEAGLEVHDIVLKLNDQWLANEEQLRAVINMQKEGEPVNLTIVRDGDRIDVAVKLKAFSSAVNFSFDVHKAWNSMDKTFSHKAHSGQDCATCHKPANQLSLSYSVDSNSNINITPVIDGDDTEKESSRK